MIVPKIKSNNFNFFYLIFFSKVNKYLLYTILINIYLQNIAFSSQIQSV